MRVPLVLRIPHHPHQVTRDVHETYSFEIINNWNHIHVASSSSVPGILLSLRHNGMYGNLIHCCCCSSFLFSGVDVVPLVVGSFKIGRRMVFLGCRLQDEHEMLIFGWQVTLVRIHASHIPVSDSKDVECYPRKLSSVSQSGINWKGTDPNDVGRW